MKKSVCIFRAKNLERLHKLLSFAIYGFSQKTWTKKRVQSRLLANGLPVDGQVDQSHTGEEQSE